MDELDRTYRHEQMEARVHNALSGEAEPHYRAPSPTAEWPVRTTHRRRHLGALPAWGSPYGLREGDALQARGNTITAENVAGAVSLSGAGSIPAGWHP